MAKLNIPETAIMKYLDHIRADYAKRNSYLDMNNPIRIEMTKKFNTSLSYEVGHKYIKIIKRHDTDNISVHSFIVNDLNGKFPLGSILKAATWKAPATNFSRGCVLTEDFNSVRWTGC